MGEIWHTNLDFFERKGISILSRDASTMAMFFLHIYMTINTEELYSRVFFSDLKMSEYNNNTLEVKDY